MFSKLRPLIFKVDPEKAHTLAIKSLKFNLIPNVLDENKNVFATGTARSKKKGEQLAVNYLIDNFSTRKKSKIELGWEAKTPLKSGLLKTYKWIELN